MEQFEFGDKNADIVLIQPVNGQELAALEDEVRLIKNRTDKAFRLIALKVSDWNRDLSPWEAPAVFGNEGFKGEAEKTLKEILELCREEGKTYLLGGYSLAGLFSLWASLNTDVFSAAAAVSPSVWFPGFTDYVKDNRVMSKAVYLSLGDKEEKTGNKMMATVGDNIREIDVLLKEKGITHTLEWNPGNHFRDFELRMARAFSWILSNPEY